MHQGDAHVRVPLFDPSCQPGYDSVRQRPIQLSRLETSNQKLETW
jgi:hypothetical protein